IHFNHRFMPRTISKGIIFSIGSCYVYESTGTGTKDDTFIPVFATDTKVAGFILHYVKQDKNYCFKKKAPNIHFSKRFSFFQGKLGSKARIRGCNRAGKTADLTSIFENLNNTKMHYNSEYMDFILVSEIRCRM
ncbi:hypothetical protein ACJX0J_020381, partial [Zea mays]